MSVDPYPEPGQAQPYDPELGFLKSLEREIKRSALRATGRQEISAGRQEITAGRHVPRRSPSSRAGHAEAEVVRGRQRRGSQLRGVSRIVRRSLALVALICLVGASAFGAREIFSGSESNPAVAHQGPFALVTSGRASSDRWSLRLYRRETDLCGVLVVGESESSRCTPAPQQRSLAVTSLVSPSRRYVFGIAGSAVAEVTVRMDDSALTVATRAPDTTTIRVAGLPGNARWFLASLPRQSGSSGSIALVRGLDGKHHPLGPAIQSCVEADEAKGCR
jgi:hypothetical protein